MSEVINKFQIKTVNPDLIGTGANTRLYMNGEPLNGVKSLKFEVQAGKIGTVTVEFYGSVDIDGEYVYQIGSHSLRENVQSQST